MAVKFKKKLQQLKISIKSWRCDVKSSDLAATVTLCNSLEVLDLKAETIPLSPNKATVRINIIKDLTALEHAKILDLHQKAKVRWVTDGDENSRFFDGPDGFTFKFIKKQWDVIKDDIFAYVKEFELTSFIPRGCNSSFITLIPKVDDPLVISDFRPISLIGCQYKILAKVLANHLAHVISSVISEVQMAFIKGRQIIDGPLIVDEIISWAKKHKKRLMFLKISSFLNSAFASVLINGSPTKEFKVKKGLRQGDPLSPFLFILAIETLNVALLQARNNNIFHGVKVGKDNIHISHI
ncbi:RNA-directed DNA polymerase, eukaryota, reverse transcriptase zinc-binding domain protein [Tanacetum coccineum]